MRNGGASTCAGVRGATLVLLVTVAILSVACGGGSDDSTTAGPTTGAVSDEDTSAPAGARAGAGSDNGALTKEEAYAMAVEGLTGDPAVTERLPRDTFDALSRLACEDLKAGGSVQKLIDDISQEPTRSGMPMRRESAEQLIAAGVRGYCPEFASKLP